MEEIIHNSIAYHQGIICEIQKIKEQIRESRTERIRFRIETKHWYGYSEPVLLKKYHKLNISKETMKVILNEAINKEKERINELIDMEIEKRKKLEK